MKRENDMSVRFLYSSALGRGTLNLIQKHHLDRLIVRFLRSGWSRLFMKWYVKKHGVKISREDLSRYSSFRDFFARDRELGCADITPEHLISPCDGWLSAFPIWENSRLLIKGSHYWVRDLLEDEALAKNYTGGTCLIIRLCASDYHHYCYIDDGFQGRTHYIEGQLHSVQPIACETYPVYTLNRRSWCLMATENFGPVVQTEIGALIVGGIANNEGNSRICRGMEKGHFELAGSTIVLLFEPDRIVLRPEVAEQLGEGREVRVEQGMWIGSRSGGTQTQ